jgi:hypothetical protein
VARSVAAALLTGGDVTELPASAIAFVKLVFDGNEQVLSLLPTKATEAVNEVDALAAASLSWLQFLKLVSASIKGQRRGDQASEEEEIANKALSIRRLLANARTARNVNEESNSVLSNTSSCEGLVSSHRDSLVSTGSTTSSISEETISQARSQTGVHHLDDSLDSMTDILALVGRKAALGTLNDWKVIDDELAQHDSGVEWGI